jgi:hypothetical protein
MALVREFDAGTLDIARLNYAIITLIPKEPNARDMKILDRLVWVIAV